ncbi:response regulator transcription factor [Plantibacter sp. MMLR14_011]|uniref:response regulator n=1 Tax=Plantibacter sp. MMLR14_011 TaxID=1898746 RepID=UPI0008DD5FF3|nr:response regulator transcription factor [Plantibacter sp. MMLR14_011]OII39962.1 DNA-binding response regulator [Plantibacter sp. MMLR14_011]
MTTVLVVDDQSLIRQAVADILSSEADLEVVGEAVDGAQAVSLARRLRPDVVLMDIRMPVLDGIGATSAICADPDLVDTRVLILTTFEEDENLVATLRAGASGFIGKGSEPEEIVRAVRAVHAGEALLSPAATRSLITKYVVAAGEPTSPRAVPTELALLTERELEVLLLVARGRSNQQIADDLVISPHTSKTHVNRIMTKVAAHDRAQLVILAYESGLLRPGADD